MINVSQEYIKKFFKLEASAGILLMLSAILAIIFANTGLNHYYEMLLSTPVEVRIGQLQVAKPLLLWINDGLMAVFFFLVGLELKRELVKVSFLIKRILFCQVLELLVECLFLLWFICILIMTILLP